MAHLSLLYRERAEIRDSPEEYRRDIEEAEWWRNKELAANKHNADPAAPAPPPPSRGASGVAPQRVQVSADVQSRILIERIAPLYPQLALAARVQGTVRFTAIIGKDGHVANIQPIGGHPLLVQSAQDAVRQWAYQPTYLNGTPVEVVTQIDVPFTLPDAR